MHFAESFLSHHTIDTPVQDLWEVFKTQCHDCLDHVRFILSSKRVRNPWINNHINRLTHRKQQESSV